MGLFVFRSLLIYPMGVASLSLLCIPLIGVSPDLQKGAIAAFLLGLGLLVLGVVLMLAPVRLTLVPPLLACSGGTLLLMSIVSAAYHGQPLRSFAGAAFETGTVGFFALLFCAILASSLLNRAHMRAVTWTFVGSALASAIVALAALGLGAQGTLAWPHLSFVLAGALILCVMHAERGSGMQRLLFGIAAALLAGAFLLFFHQIPALIAGLVLAAYAALRLLTGRGPARIAFFAIIAAVPLCAMALMGAASPLTLPPDVRPSPAVTELVGSPVYLAPPGALIGSGPNSFGYVWERYRPEAFNQTPLWEHTFTEGFSTAMTWLVTLGFLGILAYALLPLSLLYASVRSLLAAGTAQLRSEGFAAHAAFLAFCVAGSLWYAVSAPLLLMAGVSLGFCARLLSSRHGAPVELSVSARALRALPLAALGLLLCTVASLQLTAASLHAKGVGEFSASNIAGADARLAKAASLWPLSLYSRDASRAALEKVRLEARGVDPEQDTIQQGIARARRFADLAVMQDPRDFAAHLSKGSLLVTFVIAGVGELDKEADDTLVLASELSPSRPEPHYLRGVLASALDRQEQAALMAQVALQKKPDYEPAKALLESFSAPVQ